MISQTGYSILSGGTIVRSTCHNTGHGGWQLSFIKNHATLAIHFSDRHHGGSAHSRAAAQRTLNDLMPLFTPRTHERDLVVHSS